MLKKIFRAFHNEKQKEFSIIRPLVEKSNVLELDFAIRFCWDKIQHATRELNLNATEIDQSETIPYRHLGEMVLFIANPRLIINGKVLSEMITVLNSGFDACGPCFTETTIQEQKAQIHFPLMNFSTFEENNKHSLNGTTQIELSKVLDKSCILCTRQFYLKHQNDFRISNKETILKSTEDSEVVVLKNSLAFIFSDTYGTPRQDLIDLIPNTAIEILEVGCAEGNMGKLLREIKPEKKIDAVEMSTELAEKAKPIYRKTYVSTFEEFEPERSYDAIICGDVIEHMADPWEQISKIFAILKSGGCLIASLPNAGHWSLVKDMLKGKFEYMPVGITCITHLRWFTEESIKKALYDADFEIDFFERQQLQPSPKGKKFIQEMLNLGYGNKESLLTNEFTFRAKKL